jgi:2-aminoethylphosphonate-pyruvate transaminase
MLGTIPATGHVLIASNGAYGKRQQQICSVLGIRHSMLEFADNSVVEAEDVVAALKSNADISHVSFIHHETTGGVLNPLREIANSVKGSHPHVQVLVDSMSGYGAYDVDMNWGIDFLASSANKNIEGVAGFAFVLARKEALEGSRGNARSLSFDLHAQWKGFEANSQFRFTPPTHAIVAFRQALTEFNEEGGVAGRSARYAANMEILVRGFRELGFSFYVPDEVQGIIILTVLAPNDPRWEFETIYDRMAEQGFVLYPGKLVDKPSFRVGAIGRVFPEDCRNLLNSFQSILLELGFTLPLTQ